MNPSIAFIANSGMTPLFRALDCALAEDSHRCVWISTNPMRTGRLRAEGVPDGSLLVLSRKDARTPPADEDQALGLFGRCQADYGISMADLVYADRILRTLPPAQARRYLLNVALKINDFIINNNVKLMYSECTWAHEIIAAMLCRLHGGRQFLACTVRVPSERFAFFEGPQVSDFERVAEPAEAAGFLDQARTCRLDITERKVRPNFWHWWSQAPTVNLAMLRKYGSKLKEFVLYAPVDPTCKSLSHYLAHEQAHLRPWRHLAARIRRVFEHAVPGERFVLMTLHKEPEASIDLEGAPFFTDQIAIAKTLSRIIPTGWFLYVKEHALAQGDRPVAQLASLKSLFNVRLIDPMDNIHSLIERAEVVVSISGTVCLEAGVYGKKAIVMSPQFYRHLPTVHHARDLSELRAWLQAGPMPADPGREAKIDAFLAEVIANSYPGVFSDAEAVAVVMSPENLALCRHAFRDLTRRVFPPPEP